MNQRRRNSMIEEEATRLKQPIGTAARSRSFEWRTPESRTAVHLIAIFSGRPDDKPNHARATAGKLVDGF